MRKERRIEKITTETLPAIICLMRRLIRGIFETATFRQTLITTFGTIVNGALGAIFYIFSARYLGPAGFGLMIVAITVLTLVSDISDLGTDTGLVRFVGKYISVDLDKARRFLKLGLEIKLVVWVTVLIIGWLLSPLIADGIFVKHSLVTPIRLAFVGVGSSLLFSFLVRTLQGLQKFWLWSLFQIATNALRLILVGGLLILGVFRVEGVLAVYITTPILGFIVGLAYLPKNFLKVDNEKAVFKEFFHFNKWVALFTFVAAISSRLDTFISARLISATELGFYAAASQLAAIIPQIVGALGTVISPKMASMGSIIELKSYLKKTFSLVIVLAVLAIISIPISVFLIPVLYGKAYSAAIPMFIVLFLGLLFFLVSVPIHSAIFYYFSYPKLFFWLSLANILIVAVVGYYMISLFGAVGAAMSVFISNAFNFIVPTLWLARRLKKEGTT